MATKRRWVVWTALSLLSVLLVAASWAAVLRHKGRADIVRGPVPVLVVRSTSFADGGTIPARFTCQGGNLSPALEVAMLPARAKSVAIIVDDADAPFGFVHWIVFNAPPEPLEIAVGASSTPNQLHGARQGNNDFDHASYEGPCPPFGTHRYIFRVYALDTLLDLPDGATKSGLARVARGHVLAEGRLVGLFRRAP